MGLVQGSQCLQPQAGGWTLRVGRGTDKGVKAAWHVPVRGPEPHPPSVTPSGLPEQGQVGVGPHVEGWTG